MSKAWGKARPRGEGIVDFYLPRYTVARYARTRSFARSCDTHACTSYSLAIQSREIYRSIKAEQLNDKSAARRTVGTKMRRRSMRLF